MKLFRTVKRYKRKLEKRFSHKKRTQLNFACDEKIVTGIKMLAKELEVPMYPLLEHLLQLGASEVLEITKNDHLKEELCRHLVQEHLLVPVTDIEPPSANAIKARKAVDFLDAVEELAGDPKALAEIMAKMMKEATAIGHPNEL
jgi:hypothetical protein